MKKIAIIPARGGSKRIHRKNIKNFDGKPIIAYSIEAAKESELFDEIMVSTDDEEIACIARNYGANVPFMRSNENSSDYATTADVLLEVLANYKKVRKEFDYMACLYPTNPFITSKKLIDAMGMLEKYDATEILPIVQFSYPPQRAYVYSDDARIKYKWKEFISSRSQDLEKMYHDAGQFYCYNIQKFIECKGKINDNIYPIICSELEVQDIDNEEDWKLAEIKYEYIRRYKTYE